MKLARIGLFFILLFTSFSANSHNPEKLVISEIERGQLNFENEQIAAEYGAALKRQRIRRLNAMSWFKKIYIFIKAGFEHIIPQGLDHILFVLGLFLRFKTGHFGFLKCLNNIYTVFILIKIKSPCARFAFFSSNL